MLLLVCFSLVCRCCCLVHSVQHPDYDESSDISAFGSIFDEHKVSGCSGLPAAHPQRNLPRRSGEHAATKFESPKAEDLDALIGAENRMPLLLQPIFAAVYMRL